MPYPYFCYVLPYQSGAAPGDDSIQQALSEARTAAAKATERGGRGVVVVCSSTFLMPAARAALGVDEPRD